MRTSAAGTLYTHPTHYPVSRSPTLRLWSSISFAASAVALAAHTADTACAAEAPAAPGNPATVQERPQVVVIGNTPLPGLGLPLYEIPANVQTANSADLARQQSLDLADYL